MRSFRFRKAWDRLWTAICGLAVVAALLPLLSLLWLVVSKGGAGLSPRFFVDLPAPIGEPGGGVGNAIAGTFLMVGMASLVAVPVGVGAGVFLAEKGAGKLG